MSDCQKIILSPGATSWNEAKTEFDLNNYNEEVTINEDIQSEVGSNNVTLTNSMLTEINNISFQESFQTMHLLNNTKFKNVTTRANGNFHNGIMKTNKNNESFEKKRGISLNLEFRNRVNDDFKQSKVNNDKCLGGLDQYDYTNKFAGFYLQDKYQELNLNEEFIIDNALIDNDNDMSNFELQILPKLSQFYIDELENEKAVKSLKNNDSPNRNNNATSSSSTDSISSSSISYQSDSSYTNEENSIKKKCHSTQKLSNEIKIPILNQDAPCFKPLLSQNLNLAKTSTPTNNMNGDLNKAYKMAFQTYSEYVNIDNQSQSNQINNERLKFQPNHHSNKHYTCNKNSFINKTETDRMITNLRVPKSLTTHFSEYRLDDSYHQNNLPITFGHSTSYDNIGPLSGEFAHSSKFKNVTYRYRDNDNGDSINNIFSFPTQQSNNSSSRQSIDPIVLHVKNLDYKISLDEWQRILLENFRKHCKEVISVNVISVNGLNGGDKSLLGVVKLGTMEDAKLALSCLHHKKIGYKRLSVTMAFSTQNNSPDSKIVALLKSASGDSNEMALTKFIELYEARYNQSITVAELFKQKDIVKIFQSKDLQGRQIKLNSRHNNNLQPSLENEIRDFLYAPYCSLHSSQHKFDTNFRNLNYQCEQRVNEQANSIVGWLPNVVVSLRNFKSQVHKLLNDHGGQMSLYSFMDCYRYCILNENQNQNVNNIRKSLSYDESNSPVVASNQLFIDYKNGIPLEHLITCAQDVQIQFNEGCFKQIQWENDKNKLTSLQNRNNSYSKKKHLIEQSSNFTNRNEKLDQECYLGEESERKINQFSHEVVELFKGIPTCIIPLSKFNNEFHKKYGKQCRVSDYGFSKLLELLESLPHIIQIIDNEYEKKLTLTHRVQVRRFSNDLLKVLKSNSTKQMFADEFPAYYEKHFSKKFDIRDYGVCFLEDMLAELSESTICRKEIENRTFIQIPKIVQMEEELLCMHRLTFDIIDMLKLKSRFSIQFNKFIPNFHHHFGRQCKLSNYGFSKLIDLLEAIPNTVQLLAKSGVQFVQLKKEIMLDLISQNLMKLIEENNRVKISLSSLEKLYNSKYEKIYFEDFDVDNFIDLFERLPIKKNFIHVFLASNSMINYGENATKLNSSFISKTEWIFSVEPINEKELRRLAKLILRKLMDEIDEKVLILINDLRNRSKRFYFYDFLDFLSSRSSEFEQTFKILNKRSESFLFKYLSDFLQMNAMYYNGKGSAFCKDEEVLGFSETYFFAKQIRGIYKSTNKLDMSFSELEVFYRDLVKPQLIQQKNYQDLESDTVNSNSTPVFPFKKLGFVDTNLLFTQGIKLLVSIKKFADKRIFLNKEFWPKNFLEVTSCSLGNPFNLPPPSLSDASNNLSLFHSQNATTLTFGYIDKKEIPYKHETLPSECNQPPRRCIFKTFTYPTKVVNNPKL